MTKPLQLVEPTPAKSEGVSRRRIVPTGYNTSAGVGGSESPPPTRVAWRSSAATARAPPRSQFGATGRAGPRLTGSESEPVRRDERTERGAAKRLIELAVMGGAHRFWRCQVGTAKRSRRLRSRSRIVPRRHNSLAAGPWRLHAATARALAAVLIWNHGTSGPAPPVPNRNRSPRCFWRCQIGTARALTGTERPKENVRSGNIFRRGDKLLTAEMLMEIHRDHRLVNPQHVAHLPAGRDRAAGDSAAPTKRSPPPTVYRASNSAHGQSFGRETVPDWNRYCPWRALWSCVPQTIQGRS
jgi:hypothetical protein